jgi:hypothetical protein
MVDDGGPRSPVDALCSVPLVLATIWGLMGLDGGHHGLILASLTPVGQKWSHTGIGWLGIGLGLWQHKQHLFNEDIMELWLSSCSRLFDYTGQLRTTCTNTPFTSLPILGMLLNSLAALPRPEKSPSP